MKQQNIIKINRLIIFCLLTIIYFGYFNQIKASENSQAESVKIPSDLIVSWKGNFHAYSAPLINSNKKTVDDYLIYYVGGMDSSNLEYKTYSYNPAAVYNWIGNLSKTVNIQPQAGKLTIENNRAVDFVAPQIGKTVNTYQTTLKAISVFEKGGNVINLVIDKTEVGGRLASTNKLGIKELIGHGVSNFAGSPNNRRHNIKVGVEKMKGIIISPGEEFSFNKYLGPVEADQGFLPELVIKGNDTIPELGGGLCQVSSTVFRAAMAAGLEITQRKNHAYAVKYYAPQGTDATIYPGVVDLKFKNDTKYSILIWPYFSDTNSLIFDFYGTKDERIVSLSTPAQYDKKSDGSMKATWVKSVTKNGETFKQTFNSTYKPPALFHKQEKFVPAEPSPSNNQPPPFKPISGESLPTNTQGQANNSQP